MSTNEEQQIRNQHKHAWGIAIFSGLMGLLGTLVTAGVSFLSLHGGIVKGPHSASISIPRSPSAPIYQYVPTPFPAYAPSPTTGTKSKDQDATNLPITPVGLKNAITWRIVSVDPQSEYTKITIELHNTDNVHNSEFDWFNKNPLSIIADGSGKYYAMKQDGLKLPVGTTSYYDSCEMQGGQTVQTVVYFDPLKADVQGGTMKYQYHNDATPTAFSLQNQSQKPAS